MQKIRYLRLFVSTKSVYLILYYPAVSDSGAKLSKSFEKMIIEVLILYMVIPGKINFTQLGRFGMHGEQ